MAKNSWLKDNAFNMIWLAVIIAIVGGAYWGFTLGIFPLSQTQFISNLDEETLNSPAIGSSCTLEITPSSITAGDDVTGLIWTNEPLTFCEIFGKMDGTEDWLKIAEGTTDVDGNLMQTEPFSVVGDFTFAAICGDCRTNNDGLHVNPLVATTCEDSDGINKLVAGNVKIDGVTVAYDECVAIDGVKEYKCSSGMLDYEILPCDAGYSCIDTRSGGYCAPDEPESFVCTDTDDGLNYNVIGVCESSFDMTGQIDTCSGTSIINERFCTPMGTCATASIPCPAPFTACINGECKAV